MAPGSPKVCHSWGTSIRPACRACTPEPPPFSIPGIYEGFGLPIIEAMACGAPVVTSRTGAAPEVAGGAAILVDPFDVGEIEAGLERATIPEEGRRLRELGFRRARQFDWRTAAEATIEAYRRAK